MDRRGLRRVRAELPVCFETSGVSRQGMLSNLSVRGVFVRAADLPAPGEKVSLRVEVADATLDLQGEVRWVRAAEMGAGGGFGVALIDGVGDHFDWIEDVVGPALGEED